MTFEEGLRSYLLTVSDLTALVDQRIYGIIRPQDTQRPLPEVLLTRTATRRQKLFCGTNPLAYADFQIDSYAMEAKSCFDLAKVLRDTLIDFTGNMGTVDVDQITLGNEFPVTDSDPGLFRMIQIYNCWYTEE